MRQTERKFERETEKRRQLEGDREIELCWLAGEGGGVYRLTVT